MFSAGVRTFLEAIGLDVRSSEAWVKQEPQEREELVAEETSDAEDDTEAEDAMETGEDISEDERDDVSEETTPEENTEKSIEDNRIEKVNTKVTFEEESE